MKNITKYTYLNNLSEIICLSKIDKFNNLVNRIDNKKINVTSHLIHKDDTITHYEQFFFNLDNYISFIKNNLFINPNEIKIIIDLTIYNKYNKILYSTDYYYNNVKKYEKEFINMFMHNYKKNISFLKKYINIKEKSFEELINNINMHKKRTHFYFENINNKNMNFYIPIICDLEDIN